MNTKLWTMFQELKDDGYHWIELSRSLDPSTPHYGGFPGMEMKKLYDFEKTDCGFQTHRYVTAGQCGTHVDPPCHFDQNGRCLDAITPDEMVSPLCVIDLSAKTAADPDYELAVSDIETWETQYGRIPPEAFVAFRSDWGKRMTMEEIENADSNGQNHYPGWSLDALKFLVEERNVRAIGHEPADTDSASVASTVGWIGENYYLHQDRYQIEMMTNLDLCPPVGGIIICAFPKITGGSGFPARCFALVPKV